MPSVSILAVGSELLDGRVVDTNSNYVGRKLAEIGLKLSYIHSCDDKLEEISDALKFLSNHSQVIIISGGLGPTEDDLTREALAAFLNVPLEFDAQNFSELEALYQKRGRRLDPSNKKQSFFPKGAEVLKNPVGTASGCLSKSVLNGREVRLISLPGVPSEFIKMFDDSVLPLIHSLSNTPEIHRKSFEIFGLPEALVGSKISALKIPGEISVSYRAKFPLIQLVLKSANRELLLRYSEDASRAVGAEFIFSDRQDETMESALHRVLIERKIKIAVAESCTGGGLGAALTSSPGSSAYFWGGIISYSNEMKISHLGVKPETLEQYGAVSFSTAREMAAGARNRLGVDAALAITGIAGPDGGSEEKPVGTFFVGYSTKEKTYALQGFCPYSRDNVRKYAAHIAMDILRRELLGLSPHPDLKGE